MHNQHSYSLLRNLGQDLIYPVIILLFVLLSNALFAEDTNNTSPILPPLPTIPEQNAPLSTISQITVKKFLFEGNLVIATEELENLVKPYQNRSITAEELQEVKNQITLYYVNKGYINSGAIIPDQQVQDSEIKIKIIEGRLSQVDVSGNFWLHTNYLRNRIKGTENILKLDELQERLQLLQQNALIKRINAELSPGIKLGESVLRLDIAENAPYQLNFGFNNHRSPTIGAYRGEISGQFRSLTGWNDILFARYGLTRGLNDYAIGYSIPINRYDTTLSLNIERSDAKVITEPFDQLNVQSNADTYAISLSQPLYKTTTQEFLVGIRLEKRKSKTYLLDIPFSFSPGVRDGVSNLSVIRISQDWLSRDRHQVIAARSSFNFGINAFHATINQDNSPDSKFFTWLGQFQWVRRFEHMANSQILLRTDMQYAHEELLPLEKFSMGGASTVRGYRENQLTRDNGLVASIEWRIPTVSLRIPGLSKEPDDGLIYLAPFVDYGRSWNRHNVTPEPREIASVGLGLRWMPSQKLQTEIYWGKPLRKITSTPRDHDLQDSGIHFSMTSQF